MGSDRMHVTLTPNGTVAQPPAGVHDNSEEQHASPQLSQVFYATDIHSNGINRVWAGGVWIAQALPDGIERTVLRTWPKYSISITEIQGVFQKVYVEAGIKFPLRRRTPGGPGSHASLRTSCASPS